ncbi:MULTISPECIES: class I SAM-dependent methyltransferase [Lacrimispora]|uniref:Methyltransferase family protein n=3 Tax=Lacrimispora TaxID=2719231 RepID=A0A2S6HCA5_9FIRM|nr:MULTISPECIES: class I SAM-dependent methyltransferase [Clostridia]MBE5974295.1 class I SAM-dependent methyltransferase [Paenibacillaceae bacterium]MBE5988682.1 class I SAM-dependent methyltransferase [Paenibacillaceae bacterium]NNJ28202.1 methyltransferase domain-containing protein [Lacrimispora defluvii]PPK75117.1 methyltransferase family protein [Hungatella xylanolytica]
MDSIDYYNKYAAKEFEETVNQDMSEIMREFLNYLEEGDTILDLGCGSGRDSLTLYELGYDVTPLDASSEMCKLAEIHTGLDVLQMTFEQIDFDDVFDGIWACASLLHTPKKELSGILTKIARALNEKGILYMSFKLGDFEGFRGERYFSDFTADSISQLLRENGRFEILKLWETEDIRSGHSDVRWLNVLAKKK